MTNQLKTVDEIMVLVKRYAAAGISTMPSTYDTVRAAITDLHTAAGEVSALLSRVAELEAALMPFAEAQSGENARNEWFEAAGKAMGLDL